MGQPGMLSVWHCRKGAVALGPKTADPPFDLCDGQASLVIHLPRHRSRLAITLEQMSSRMRPWARYGRGSGKRCHASLDALLRRYQGSS